jgi:hypothetical protein
MTRQTTAHLPSSSPSDNSDVPLGHGRQLQAASARRRLPHRQVARQRRLLVRAPEHGGVLQARVKEASVCAAASEFPNDDGGSGEVSNAIFSVAHQRKAVISLAKIYQVNKIDHFLLAENWDWFTDSQSKQNDGGLRQCNVPHSVEKVTHGCNGDPIIRSLQLGRAPKQLHGLHSRVTGGRSSPLRNV